MLKELLNKLKQDGIDTLIYTSNELYPKIEDVFSPDSVKQINDVRSATFYAFGQAKMLKKSVLILLNEDYISSSYTTLIEAWMQRVPLILVSYNSKSYQSTAYLERCLDEVFFLEKEEDIEICLRKVMNKKGPCLVKVKEDLDSEELYNYDVVLNLLKEFDYNGDLFCYNPQKAEENNFHVISTKHKYGVMSKYVGYLMGGKSAVLCIPDSLMCLETNVFNLRHFPSNFLMFVIKTDFGCCVKYRKWIENNNIAVKEFSEIKSPKLLSFDTPTVIIC